MIPTAISTGSRSMTDLLDAVDALTKRITRKIMDCPCVKCGGRRSHVFNDDPLLVQLETAVTSAIGGGGGGGSATGSVLNDEALYRLSVIRSQLGDWCRLAGVKHDRADTVGSLRRWYVAVLASNADTTFYVNTLRTWASTIRDLLDPPKTVPLAGPCPVCKATNWVGPDESLRASPVAVLYDHADPYRSVRAVCRVDVCDAEWVGAEAVEELIEEMSEHDA